MSHYWSMHAFVLCFACTILLMFMYVYRAYRYSKLLYSVHIHFASFSTIPLSLKPRLNEPVYIVSFLTSAFTYSKSLYQWHIQELATGEDTLWLAIIAMACQRATRSSFQKSLWIIGFTAGLIKKALSNPALKSIIHSVFWIVIGRTEFLRVMGQNGE